jgi:hypothetical protein
MDTTTISITFIATIRHPLPHIHHHCHHHFYNGLTDCACDNLDERLQQLVAAKSPAAPVA